MAAGATGWDWCGINLDDGSALMAFRMRGKDGATALRAAGRFIRSRCRTWKSPRTGADVSGCDVMVKQAGKRTPASSR